MRADFLTLLFSRAVAQALTLLAGLVLVRILIPAEFGAYSLATTTLGLAGVLVDFGLDPALTREWAAGRGGAGLLHGAIRLRAALGLSMTAGLLPLAALWPVLGRPDLLLIGALSLPLRGAWRAYAAALTGIGKARPAARIEGLGAVVGGGCTVPLALIGGAGGAVFALPIGALAGLIAAAGVWRRNGPHPAGVRVTWRALVTMGAAFAGLSLAGAIFQGVDMYMVGLFTADPAALGLYAAPFRVLNVLLLPPTAWGVVALPRYVADLGMGRFRRDMIQWAAVGVALSAGVSLLSGPITAAALGPEYAASAPILAVLCWMTLPVCLSAPLIAILTARGGQMAILLCVVGAGVGAVAANLIVGSAGGGLLGIAAVKVGGMAVLAGLYGLAYGVVIRRWKRR